jgi:glycosyltransferase involved in cell wall biosynthesis
MVDYFHVEGKGVLGYLKNIKPLQDVLKKESYPIIHAHYGFCGVLAQLARRKEKLIVSFMGEPELRVGEFEKPLLSERLMILIHKWYAKHKFDTVIVKSQNLMDLLPSLANIHIIPNGVDVTQFIPLDQNVCKNKLGLSIDKKVILWIGNQSRKEKGFQLALDTILGLPKDKYAFCTIDKIEHKELLYYYNAADVFLLSSLSEGSPNVVKEAMACNCPIVTTPVGDVEFLVSGTNGCYISKSFSPDELRELICICTSFESRSLGREKLLELGLTANKVATRLIELYQNTIIQ